jgi:hypothetical protein
MRINGMNDCAYASSKGLTSGIIVERLVGVVVLACVTSLLTVSDSDDMMTRLSHLGDYEGPCDVGQKKGRRVQRWRTE